jgi:hypothetical protein
MLLVIKLAVKQSVLLNIDVQLSARSSDECVTKTPGTQSPDA